MEQEQKLKLEEQIITMLRTVFDPEIPVDVYSLGLVYKIDLQDDGSVNIDMTLTAQWPTSSLRTCGKRWRASTVSLLAMSTWFTNQSGT